MNGGAILTWIGGLAVGAVGTYATFYFRDRLTWREQIAKSLADYYASAAAVYYAEREYSRRIGDSPERQVTYYALYDQHYKEFLSASTFLASLVRPDLKDRVLSIEDLWDKKNEDPFEAVSGKTWFDELDAIRDEILRQIPYSSLTNPFWKRPQK
jgi:hypothetical protein